LLCGLSNSLPVLILARVIQAIGAAGTMSTNQGIITQIFPAHERGRALGISGASVALGTLVGPPLGGLIISLFSWKYIFLINLPIGVVAWIWSRSTLPRERPVNRESLDWKGAILFILVIVPLFGCLTFGQTIGYEHPLIIGGFVVAALALTAFLWVERNCPAPLLDLSIFENQLFSISIFCSFLSFVAINSSIIVQPFYLQDVLKMTPGLTGLFLMVYPLILMVVAPASGYLSDKIGSELLTFVGLVLISGGLFLMSTLNQFSSLWVIGIFMAIMSLGNGLFQSPNTSLVMSTVPRHKLGIAGSVNALVRNLGMVFGIAVSTSILYHQMSRKIGHRVVDYIPGRDDVFVYGMRYVYITAAAICLTGAILTAFRLYYRKHDREKAEIEEEAA
jgi:EmrB/QacA subfamily drug resistance transporter